ncbi:MAG: MBL fold hydrolase [Hyperthermus sp.]|nr:MAG: MBL fold hydrolase [Hyperthermus sp.]
MELVEARLTVLVDNASTFIDGRITEYGFSMLIEARLDNGDSTLILMDTGQTGRPLLHNLELEGVSPKEIDYLVFSHRHSDHTGGLRRFLEARKGKPVPVIAHTSLFEPSFAIVNDRLYEIGMPISREEAEKLGARFILTSRPLNIVPGVTFSGEVPSRWGPRHTKLVYRVSDDGGLIEDDMRDDAFLALTIGSEAYIITGCGHAGVENILGYAAEITGKKIAGLMGGLHLYGITKDREEEIIESLRQHPLKILAGMHCTGPFIQKRLRDEFPKAYKLIMTGGKIRLPL